MPRRRVTKTISVFGDKVIAEEQYYQNNESLPTNTRYTFTPKMAEAMDMCKNDICYFAEHFFTIIDKTKRKKIPLRDYQRRILHKMQTETRLIMLTSRQCGKTTLMTIYALWRAMFFPDQTIRIIANKRERALEDLARIHLAYQEMDNWVKETVDTGTWSKGSIKFSNGSTIAALATSAASARGDTISCLLLDELAFVEEGIARQFWTSVGPTLSANPDAQLFISSTPKGEGNLLWELCDKAEKKQNDFVLEKVTWDEIDGRDEAWKEKTIKNDCNGDVALFQQEYECRFLGAKQSPFPHETFEYLQSIIKEPIDIQDNGNLWIWNYPKNNRVYSIGVDVAEGIGQDYSVIQVFDLTNLRDIEQCATWTSNKTSIATFIEKILEIAQMYGNPLLAIERNACGTEVCDKIGIDKAYPRMVSYGQRYYPNRPQNRFGIINTHNTRLPAILNLKHWMSDFRRTQIYDKRFVEQLRHFERHPTTGKWAHAKGYHDDLIMAAVWALYVLHRQLVEDYLIVTGYEMDKMQSPVEVKNLFDYHVDEELYKTLETVQYDPDQNYRLPVAVFGINDKFNSVINQRNRVQEQQKRVGEWICFLDEGTPLFNAQKNRRIFY